MLTAEQKKAIDTMFQNVCRNPKSIYYSDVNVDDGVQVRYVRLSDVIDEINKMMAILKESDKEQVNG